MNYSFPATQQIASVIFVGCVATTLAGALIAALTARVIRGVCGLALCCLGLAGLFYFLHSPFLALMEILIYIGAVCVTVAFAVMLAEPEEQRQDEPRTKTFLWGGVGVLISLAICLGLSRLGLMQSWNQPVTPFQGDSVKQIGVALLTTYSLAFELISLALLVAILGALAIARGGRNQP